MMDVTRYSEVTSDREYLELLNELTMLGQKVREAKQYLEKAGLEYMKENNLKMIPVNEDVCYVKANKTTDRYETEAILKEMGCPQDLVNMLPKNPKFKKSVVTKDPRVAGYWSQDISETLEIKKFDKKRLEKK